MRDLMRLFLSRLYPVALAVVLDAQLCLAQGGLGVPTGGGPSTPAVLSAPQAYTPGASEPAGLDVQGGLIPATGFKIPAVTCSSACTTFGAGANGVLLTTGMWPYSTIDFGITSFASGGGLVVEQSNDNTTSCAASTNWYGVNGLGPSAGSGGGFSTSPFTTGHWAFSPTAACVRIRATTYSSGSFVVDAYLTAPPQSTRAATVGGYANNSTPAGAIQTVGVSPNPYPSTAVAITAVGTGSTGAVTATLAASASLHTYICSVEVSAIGGTAAVGPITITNLMGNTFTINLAASAAGNNYNRTFSPCIPTSAINTTIVITTTADGTASGVAVNASGFQL